MRGSMPLLTVSTTIDISVLHSAEVAHFAHKSCYPSHSANQALSSHFQGMTVWVHYETFTKTLIISSNPLKLQPLPW